MNKEIIDKYYRELIDHNSHSSGECMHKAVGEGFIIRYLTMHSDKDVIAKDLSDGLSCSTARISALLNRLEENGIVKREKSKVDSRKTIVRLTDYGTKVSLKNREKFYRKFEQLLTEIGEEKYKMFLEVIETIRRIEEDYND